MYRPDFETFLKLAKPGCLIPVEKEILADTETPVGAYLKVCKGKEHSFLLESAEGGEKWGRYSFIGFGTQKSFKAKDGFCEEEDRGNIKRFESNDPLSDLKSSLFSHKLVQPFELPRFFGGMVGFLSYDYIRYIEKIPDETFDDLGWPDLYFIMPELLLIFDNFKQTIKVVRNVFIDEGSSPIELYDEALRKIDRTVFELRFEQKPSIMERPEQTDFHISSNIEKGDFEKIVSKIKEYIYEGEAIQVVISKRWHTELLTDPFSIYRCLRYINPSPYMFFLKFDDLFLCGSSPEILVRLEGDKVELRPIAGTRPRGKTEEEDIALEKELLSDPKELAEHIMLVDLGRNDVGKVSEIGSVSVKELMVVERYSHVMHIVSDIVGKLSPGKDGFDVIRACFPAGTVSGAPKIRAMEIIEEFEPSKRGPYAGAVGYFSLNGNIDFCITIRTMFIKGDDVYIQAGVGVVADSVPENEFMEAEKKGEALFNAYKMALSRELIW